MKKFLLSLPVAAFAVMFSFSASAQQNAALTEDVGYELPAMVSEKTVPFFDQQFANMPGVKVTEYCFNLSLVVFSVDRSLQKDNRAIEEKIHSIFHTDDTMMRLEPKPSFNKSGFLIMCNEEQLIQR